MNLSRNDANAAMAANAISPQADSGGGPLLPYARYLAQWNLAPDGPPVKTPGSCLLPVRYDDRPAMLKIAADANEIRGGQVLRWWGGQAAAEVFQAEGPALLMERATGDRSLMHMALHGQDDEASRIACQTLANLHQARPQACLPELVPLKPWFLELAEHDTTPGTVLHASRTIAASLVDSPQDPVVLHGDIHHDNILDFGERGWLVIDPKGLLGERGFDYANLILNPDLPTAAEPRRFQRQVGVIAQGGNLEASRLLGWVLAFAGLSAIWFLQDEDDAGAERDLAVARLAAQALDIPCQ